VINPLIGFKWDSLYQRYDLTCKKYDPSVPYLYAFEERPPTDRQLYHALVSRARNELSTEEGLSTATYEAIMYWKLYSQPAATKNICERIHADTTVRALITKGLRSLCHVFPATLPRALPDVQALYRALQKHATPLHGMKTSCSLAVRTTFLHFAYPEVIPLFDKQVLLAVGVREKNANQKPHYLFEYMQHAWALSANPSLVPTNWQESPLRLLDMALWVNRGVGNA
jgi:hypothetical protein